ncbi:MAG TPA: FAD binding domain-containing protein [Alphaproteobacteria bacterium]|nr:FAD binding domain-containing protein [Alphaproteobacteria bacterium]
MRPFDYTSPTTVDEAMTLLGQNGHDYGHGIGSLAGVQPLAGGTDLLTLMKADVAAPSQLVNIKGLAGLPRGVRDTPQGLTLGALTTLTEIETHAIIRQRYPLLAQAAAVAATPQLRNMATLGGNLLQRPRCWYFRHRLLDCWLKGGEVCPAYDGENQFHALFGGGPCYAVHPSDLAPALLAVDAQIGLQGRQTARVCPVAEFFAVPEEDHRRETRIGRDELLLSVLLPPLPAGTRTLYLKAMDRKVWAFALVSVAASLRLDGSRVAEVHLVLGGVAPIPWRASVAEQELLGAEVGDDLFARAADAALSGAEPLRHNAYKVPLVKSLIRRALTTLAVP